MAPAPAPRGPRPAPRARTTQAMPEFLAAMGRPCATRASGEAFRARRCAHADVSESYLAQLEAGEANASVLLLRSVARALRMPLPSCSSARDSVEQRLIRRFLDGLPAHRLEDVRSA